MEKHFVPFQLSAKNENWDNNQVFGKGALPWQQNAFDALRDSRFSFCVAFMGSGKSYVQLMLASDEIIKSKFSQKQLIIVPQSHIADGFVGKTVYVQGKPINWEVLQEHQFISDKVDAVKMRLRDWLLTPGHELFAVSKGKRSHLKGVTAVTSHAALALVWKMLTAPEKKRAVHNLTLRVDEAHHLNNIMALHEHSLSVQDIKDTEQEANNLSQVCSYIVKSTDETAHLCLTTATPFRGDQDDILEKGAKAKFKVYYLPFFDHWASLGIKNFGLEYLVYKGTPVKMCLDRIASEPDERHMVIIPSSTRKWRAAGTEHQELLKKLNKMFPGEVVDLVDPNPTVRKESKLRLHAEPRTPQEGESKIRVVVTCMVGREGTDWCPCSRLHNLAVESSITLAVQTLGRPFRRFSPLKTEVNCFNYVPEFENPDEAGSVKDVLSHRTNALLTCMIFDEGFAPILLPKIPGVSSRGKDNKISLRDAVEAQGVNYEQFKLALINAVEANEDLTIGSRNPAATSEVIRTALEDLGITGNFEAIYAGANRFLARSWFVGHNDTATEMGVRGIDVSFLLEQGYDKLIEFVDDNDKSVVFTGAFSERDLIELKNMFNESFDERVSRIFSAVKTYGV